MKELLLPFFKWSENSWLGLAISSRTYPFAVIEVVHLFGLTLLLGGIVFISMRLFGLILRDVPLPEFSRTARAWTLIGLVISTLTGVSLYASESMKLYNSPSFWIKMAFFFTAIVFHFTIFRNVTLSERSGAGVRAFAGLISLALWFGVGVAGRAIGFL
jgi:hypothetical protein